MMNIALWLHSLTSLVILSMKVYTMKEVRQLLAMKLA